MPASGLNTPPAAATLLTNGTAVPAPAITTAPGPTLPHLGLSKADTDFPATFGDVKFVCAGGSMTRMAEYAKLFSALTSVPSSGNLCRTDRFVMYKTGPVLWVNHGMGVPSLSIMLCEVFKLLSWADAGPDVEFVRMGTCGGIGVPPGTVIVSEGVMNGALEKDTYAQWIHGKQVKRDAVLDQRLGDELFRTAVALGVPVDRGYTLCADDFYEGQMRLDGPFCDYGAEDKMAFLRQLSQLGVKNIEMEGTGFAALTHRAHYPATLCCVVIVNRLEADTLGRKGEKAELEKRPFEVVSRYLLKRMAESKAQNGVSAT